MTDQNIAATPPMLAYHSDPALRASVLAQLEAHAAADEIVQGRYWEGGRGCAVGCLTHEDDGGHCLYPIRWGIPRILAHLEDRIFEGLPLAEAKLWPLRFMGAIRPGADLSLVWTRFALAILTDPERGVARLTEPGSDQRNAVEAVAELLRRAIAGQSVTEEQWTAAAANAAAAYAAARAAAAAADAHAAAAARTEYWKVRDAAFLAARERQELWLHNYLRQLGKEV